jgi:putative redox protein
MMAASDSNGHSVVIGRSPDPQFMWAGMKPSDLLLVAAASCSAYDVIEILTKQREPLEDLKVICSAEQRREPPYKFTSLHLHYIVYGAVKAEKLERAIRLSEEKYCSVTNSLDVPVSSDYEIVE